MCTRLIIPLLIQPIIAIHNETLSRFKEESPETNFITNTDTDINTSIPKSNPQSNDTSQSERIPDNNGDGDGVAGRCETVLNTTLAEFEQYHTQKREAFETITKTHLDSEIAFYEKVRRV